MGNDGTLRPAALLVTVILFGMIFNGASAGENRKYMQRMTVDTLIQQAFVNLNAAGGDMPGSDLRRRQAIEDAKKVTVKLRSMARGDPNEKYVLWKTGELESQILLEERDIILKKLEKNQKERNAVIDVYNKEVGKKRPDFIILKKAIDEARTRIPKWERKVERFIPMTI